MSGYDEPFWTLEQCVGWIKLREREPVLRTSAAHLEAVRARVIDNERVRDPRRRPRPTPFFIACRNPLAEFITGFPDLAIDHPDRLTGDLLRALASGEIVANGLSVTDKKRHRIEALFWIDHTIACNEHGLLSDRGPAPRHTVSFTDIRIDAAVVRKRWPEPAQAAKTHSGAEKEAAKRLRRMMGETPSEQPAAKDEILRNLREDIPGLSGIGFERAWAEAISKVKPPGWGRPGRPRKLGQKLPK